MIRTYCEPIAQCFTEQDKTTEHHSGCFLTSTVPAQSQSNDVKLDMVESADRHGEPFDWIESISAEVLSLADCLRDRPTIQVQYHQCHVVLLAVTKQLFQMHRSAPYLTIPGRYTPGCNEVLNNNSSPTTI